MEAGLLLKLRGNVDDDDADDAMAYLVLSTTNPSSTSTQARLNIHLNNTSAP